MGYNNYQLTVAFIAQQLPQSLNMAILPIVMEEPFWVIEVPLTLTKWGKLPLFPSTTLQNS